MQLLVRVCIPKEFTRKPHYGVTGTTAMPHFFHFYSWPHNYIRKSLCYILQLQYKLQFLNAIVKWMGTHYYSRNCNSYFKNRCVLLHSIILIGIAIYHLRLFLCTSTFLRLVTRQRIGEAHALLFQVHHGLRDALPKTGLQAYRARIKRLLDALVPLCKPFTKRMCNSHKYRWPLHWWFIRTQLGCEAAEKSLERKLGESQKINFKYTNHNDGHEVLSCSECSIAIYNCNACMHFAIFTIAIILCNTHLNAVRRRLGLSTSLSGRQAGSVENRGTTMSR